MSIIKQYVIAALGFFCVIGPANAMLITDQVDFAAYFPTGISGKPVPQPPVNPVIGSFDVTFNPSTSYANPVYSGFFFNSLNIAPGSGPLNFEYPLTGPHAGTFSIGTVPGGQTNEVLGGFDNFALMFIGITGPDPRLLAFAYSQAGGNLFITNTGTVSVRQIATIPLPASLPMFMVGLAGIAIAGRHRKRLLAA